jgi:hypothetical protein
MAQAARMRQLKQQQRHGDKGSASRSQQRQPGSPYQISAAASARSQQGIGSKGAGASPQRRSLEQQPGRH